MALERYFQRARLERETLVPRIICLPSKQALYTSSTYEMRHCNYPVYLATRGREKGKATIRSRAIKVPISRCLDIKMHGILNV